MILNIFHFQGRLLEEIQISQGPAQAPSLEHKEASKTQELFSSFMLNLLQHQAVRKWTVSFMFCIAKGGTEFWIYSSSGHKGNTVKEPLDLVFAANLS